MALRALFTSPLALIDPCDGPSAAQLRLAQRHQFPHHIHPTVRVFPPSLSVWSDSHSSLAAILISRFLSNLQEVKQRLASPRSLPHIGSIGTIQLRPLGSSREPGAAVDVPVDGDGLLVDHGTGDVDARSAVVEIEEVYRADA